MYTWGCDFRGKRKDKESGVSRGIDFQMVSNVVNFDFPPDVDAYVHRVGRQANKVNFVEQISMTQRESFYLLTCQHCEDSYSYVHQRQSIYLMLILKL